AVAGPTPGLQGAGLFIGLCFRWSRRLDLRDVPDVDGGTAARRRSARAQQGQGGAAPRVVRRSRTRRGRCGVKALALFAGVSVVIVVLGGWVLSLVWPSADAAHAIRASALVAV